MIRQWTESERLQAIEDISRRGRETTDLNEAMFKLDCIYYLAFMQAEFLNMNTDYFIRAGVRESSLV
jgi:hypothetical protein